MSLSDGAKRQVRGEIRVSLTTLFRLWARRKSRLSDGELLGREVVKEDELEHQVIARKLRGQGRERSGSMDPVISGAIEGIRTRRSHHAFLRHRPIFEDFKHHSHASLFAQA